ncbi:hypothetical protein AB0G15_05825 [Streptosporangium sp. NPDC023825]|uniref:hypothetical protein n=1 Tax=Streptosporangium sp. NPDC023825 TaxID=3154909 RepID=UPI0034144E03
MLIHMGGRSPALTETFETERFTVTVEVTDHEETLFDKVVMIGAYVAGYLCVTDYTVHLYDRSGEYAYCWQNQRNEWVPGLSTWLDVNISDQT